jgi:hypothetical protein
VALSFFYRMVRRVVEILCVDHMDALTEDAGILRMPRISAAQITQLASTR